MDDLVDGSGQTELTSDDGDPDQRLNLDCVRQAGEWAACEPLEPLLRGVARQIARCSRLPGPDCEAAVAFSDDASVAALNARFRKLDKPTNVLSFPAVEAMQPTTSVRFLGDVVLAAETVVREAREKAISPRDHATHLVVHGVLHLIGHDHQSDADAETMERAETAILAGLDIADPYQQQQHEEVTDHSR